MTPASVQQNYSTSMAKTRCTCQGEPNVSDFWLTVTHRLVSFTNSQAPCQCWTFKGPKSQRVRNEEYHQLHYSLFLTSSSEVFTAAGMKKELIIQKHPWAFNSISNWADRTTNWHLPCMIHSLQSFPRQDPRAIFAETWQWISLCTKSMHIW